MSFVIDMRSPHWLGDPKDQANDLCLHANVFLKIDEEVVDPSSSKSWCVSAGALRFLRSLFDNHLSGKEEHLLPCCGHFMIAKNGGNEVDIIGCPYGIDFSVFHHGAKIELVIAEGISHTISYEEYKEAVLAFAKSVEEFYNQSDRKVTSDDFTKAGYEAFWTEWHTLIERSD